MNKSVPWEPGTLAPLDLGILGPIPSSYYLFNPPTSPFLFLLLSSFGMVLYGGVDGVEFWQWRLRLTIGDGPIYVKKLWGGGSGCTFDYNISCGPFSDFGNWDWRGQDPSLTILDLDFRFDNCLVLGLYDYQ